MILMFASFVVFPNSDRGLKGLNPRFSFNSNKTRSFFSVIFCFRVISSDKTALRTPFELYRRL